MTAYFKGSRVNLSFQHLLRYTALQLQGRDDMLHKFEVSNSPSMAAQLQLKQWELAIEV